jgi:hypothetical protein
MLNPQQQQAARDAEGRKADAQGFEQNVADESERDQDDRRDDGRTRRDRGLLRGRRFPGERDEVVKERFGQRHARTPSDTGRDCPWLRRVHVPLPIGRPGLAVVYH